MKKRSVILLVIAILAIFLLSSCQAPEAKEEIRGNIKTYFKMSDGTWKCDGYTYKYCLEISGRMPNVAVDSTYVYLSNKANIAFEQAYMASGISSDSADYFSVGDAVLVEMH